MEHIDNFESVNNDYYLSLTTLLEGAKNGSSCMVRLANKNQKHRIYFDGMNILNKEDEFYWLHRAAE